MKKISTYIFIVISFISTVSVAQDLSAIWESNLDQAERYFDNFSYSKAVEKYKVAFENINKDSVQNYVSLKIAESYRKLNDPEQAVEWYAKVLTSQESNSALYFLHYAQALSAVERYADAKVYYRWYDELKDGDEVASAQLKALENQSGFYDKVGQVNIKKADFNASNMDFAPAFYRDSLLLFVSSRKKSRLINGDFNWDESDYLDLFEYNPANGSVSRFFKHINTKYHEGPVVIYNNDTELLLTRNNYYKNKLKKSTDGVTKLQLFHSRYLDDKWSEPQPINLNSTEYSIGHPAISGDGKTLYFVSDMPGGYGGTDIYKSEIDSAGSWGQPINLGESINTSANEMFPFVWQDQYLYFASNGYGGLGGLDIFGLKLQDSEASVPVNLGVPINSSLDDFSLIVDETGTAGFLSSNREGSKNQDDIYKFSSSVSLIADYKLVGSVIDSEEHFPLANSTVTLSGDTNSKSSVTTNDAGQYQFLIKPNKTYLLEVSRKGYISKSKKLISQKNDSNKWVVTFELLKAYDFGLKGVIVESGQDRPLDSVSVHFIDNFTGKVVLDTMTSKTGEFYLNLNDKKLNERISFQIRIEKEGFLSKTLTFNRELDKPGILDISENLDFALDKIEVGADIGKLIDIQPIYFDLGKSEIRKDAAKELDKIVEVMKANPKMVIELGSHTDARGSDAFNLRLSDKRAKASATYIVSQGIDKDRISGKGYGETQLINNCGNGVNCSEEEHQLNRRTEFKVLKF